MINIRNQKAISPVVAVLIIIVITIVVSVVVAYWMGTIDNKPSYPAEEQTTLTGYFSGQIIDATTQNPIPNATVYFYKESFTIATLTTNATGFYQIQNVTLPSDIYLLAKAPGYYLMPPTRVPLFTNQSEGIYTFAAAPLQKTSHNTKLSVNAYTAENGTTQKEVYFYILNGDTVTLNSPRLELDMHVNSRDSKAAGPYFGLNLHVTVNTNGGPTDNAIVDDIEPNPVLLHDGQSETSKTIIQFYESGTYKVSIDVYDVPYYSDLQETNYFDHYTFTVKVDL
jgi:flagellin-like protein